MTTSSPTQPKSLRSIQRGAIVAALVVGSLMTVAYSAPSFAQSDTSTTTAGTDAASTTAPSASTTDSTVVDDATATTSADGTTTDDTVVADAPTGGVDAGFGGASNERSSEGSSQAPLIFGAVATAGVGFWVYRRRRSATPNQHR
jgi:hypothetical protein